MSEEANILICSNEDRQECNDLFYKLMNACDGESRVVITKVAASILVNMLIDLASITGDGSQKKALDGAAALQKDVINAINLYYKETGKDGGDRTQKAPPLD